jgi:hypothetical protein
VSRPFDISSPAAVRCRLTYLYHLFPNVTVATFPNRVKMFVLEPRATDRTVVVTYTWRDGAPPRGQPDLVLRGAEEDFNVARSIQRGLASGANESLQFGRFEGAIAHFHRSLDAALAGAMTIPCVAGDPIDGLDR